MDQFMKKNYLKSLIVLIISFMVILSFNSSFAIEEQSNYKTINGMSIYYGVIPSEIVEGHPKQHSEREMHGGVPRDSNQFHLIVSLFDNETNKRISDAEITATINELGLSGETKKLEPMNIADTITYGNYFRIDINKTYEINLQIQRPNIEGITKVKFTHLAY